MNMYQLTHFGHQSSSALLHSMSLRLFVFHYYLLYKCTTIIRWSALLRAKRVCYYILYVHEQLYVYGIQYVLFNTEGIFISSYRKLDWVGFEPTSTEFHSDALTDWAIKPWVQLAFRSNFVQLLQFHLFVQCSNFISAIAFVSCHICF